MLLHYAPMLYLRLIVMDSCLKVSNAEASEEVPLLWFSANQRWEPTASKIVRTQRGLVRLTFEEQAAKYGCIRFGLPAGDHRLLNWLEACHAGRTPRESRRGMERLGRKLGANPDDWFASVIDVPLADLCFQMWLSQHGWKSANPQELETTI